MADLINASATGIMHGLAIMALLKYLGMFGHRD